MLPAAAVTLAEGNTPRREGGGATTVAAPVEPTDTQPTLALRVEPLADSAFSQQAFEFLGRHWPWALALLVVPLGAWLWAWVVYRRSYDEAGLPRGPRLG